MLQVKEQFKILKNKYTTNEERIVLILLSINILIDFVNGLFDTFEVSLSMGKVVRVLYILASLYYIFKSVNLKKKYVVFGIIATIFFGLSSLVDTGNLKAFMFNAEFNFRMAYYIIVLTCAITLVKNQILSDSIIKDSMIINGVLMCIFMFSTYILGIGDSSYRGNIGYKGVFISLNGLSITVLILFVFVVDKLVEKNFKIKYLVVFFGLLLIIFNLATKAGYAFAVLVIGIYSFPILKRLWKEKLKGKTKEKLIIAGICIIAIIIIYFIFKGKIDRTLSRQIYMFNMFRERGDNFILSYLVSGRNTFLNGGLHVFQENLNILTIFTGIGAHMQWRGMTEYLNGIGIFFNGKNIEMDIFDILISNGILGMIFVYGYTIFLSIKGINKERIKKQKVYLISIILILIYSVLGGHVFTNPLCTTILVMCLAGLHVTKNDFVDSI